MLNFNKSISLVIDGQGIITLPITTYKDVDVVLTDGTNDYIDAFLEHKYITVEANILQLNENSQDIILEEQYQILKHFLESGEELGYEEMRDNIVSEFGLFKTLSGYRGIVKHLEEYYENAIKNLVMTPEISEYIKLLDITINDLNMIIEELKHKEK